MMKPIPFQFSEKHRLYMQRARICTLNVAEGAVRSGKTVDNLFVFAHLLDFSRDRLHLATGASARQAKAILGDGNGFGLEWIFQGRCRWAPYKGAEALFVNTTAGEKIILFVGGKNADAYKRIRGLSIGMWIATEINLHHPTMIREAFSRQIAAKDRHIFWDLNPESPGAVIYREYLDRYAAQSAAGTLEETFYNYEHFTIFDNCTITPARIREITAQYEEGSLWYRRDILGERCAAEGMVYPRFAENPDAFLVEKDEIGPLALITVGVDFGGNRSKTTFAAVGFSPGFRYMTALCDASLDNHMGEVTSEDVNAACEAFLLRVAKDYPGVPIRYVFCDSEAQYLIHGLKRAQKQRRTISNADKRTNIPFPSITNARKRPIHERIRCETSLLAAGRLRLTRDCPLLRAGLSGAVWDASKEKDVRLDNFTSDIDILDAFEYAFEQYMEKLVSGSSIAPDSTETAGSMLLSQHDSFKE